MLLSLDYFVLRRLLHAVGPSGRGDREREAELLVLRPQGHLPRRSPADLSRARPDAASGGKQDPAQGGWNAFVVTPRTLLRWHRELVSRKRTYRRVGLEDQGSLQRPWNSSSA